MKIPMSSPDIDKTDIEAVLAVLRTPYLSIGPQIKAFEQAFASYVGVAHAIAVSSGTAGLHLAIVAAGVTDGDLVITTPFSFVASANVMLYERAIPVFVDIDPHSLNLDPAQVADAAQDILRGGAAAQRWIPPSIRNLEAGFRRLKCILPVHAFGQPADLDPINAVARQHRWAVIEDACEAIGARYKGRQVGRLGCAGVFAFYPNKQITTGEGGVIVTDDDEWNHLFRSLRNQGRDVFDAWLNHSRLGYNYRLDEMSAALGAAQMSRIEELLAKREQVAHWYAVCLEQMEGVTAPFVAPTTTRSSWFVYVVRFAPELDRNRIMALLQAQGIPSRPYFNPIHLQPFYRQRFGYAPGDFPITEQVAASTLALPFFSNMSQDQVAAVCEILRQVIVQARREARHAL